MSLSLVFTADGRLQDRGRWMEGSPATPSTGYLDTQRPRPDPKPPYSCNSIKPQKHTFFRLGRVFRFPWSETAGTTAFGTFHNAHEFVRGRENGTHIYQKNRIFVVIREGQESCTVLPITTYGNQGVAKLFVDKSQHGVIYTGTEPTPITYQEALRPGSLQQHAIRVIGDQPTCTLHAMSRINYGQVHTVHHNVEVESIGMVHEASLPYLLQQFRGVWVLPFLDIVSDHRPLRPPTVATDIFHETQPPPPSANNAAHSQLGDPLPSVGIDIPTTHQPPPTTFPLPNTTGPEAIQSTAAHSQRAVGDG
ncbi:hypothetical protein M409DRAFT_29903 [Zasmidium cellare ATCC 36951]|uniref:DUF6590 domain-containing protein n=1 Tax=Zasmidium cellare ATCC 36951 TaxID=1080233 RepID=A0A6A6BXM1_ZASCE|nr:uncharacterized protein M409DRAFT_29903 [Zasmidium cellare ATCC 36951]KAF2159584.1 hypothetical protein M409DRAFT_29903 [Zasmidium cellare ATCC 36951]